MRLLITAIFPFIFSILLISCGPGAPTRPNGKYSAGFYYANFRDNGSVSFYKAPSITADINDYACMTKGKWKMDGDNIVISGLSNPNCPDASYWNCTVGIDNGIRLYKKEAPRQLKNINGADPDSVQDDNYELEFIEELSSKIREVVEDQATFYEIKSAYQIDLIQDADGPLVYTNKNFWIYGKKFYAATKSFDYSSILYLDENLCVYSMEWWDKDSVELYDRGMTPVGEVDLRYDDFNDDAAFRIAFKDGDNLISPRLGLKNNILSGDFFELFLPKTGPNFQYQLFLFKNKRSTVLADLKSRGGDNSKYVGAGQQEVYTTTLVWSDKLDVEQNLILYGSEAYKTSTKTIRDNGVSRILISERHNLGSAKYRIEGSKKINKTYDSGHQYFGEFLNGKRNGFGVMTFPSGHIYEGNWEDDIESGQGTMTYPSGNIYEGNWEDDKKNGQGTITNPDGTNYVGEYKDDKKNGHGTITNPAGVKYVGEWKDDKKNGHGTSTNPNGANYVGEWKDDKINGHGTYTYPDGTNYVGEYKDHKRNGQGTYTWLDGSKYVGEWKDNLHSGLGEKYYSDLGHVYEGNWVEGRREGHGKLFFENGSVFTGVWEYVANSLRPSAGSGNLQLTTGDIIPGFVSSDNVFIERGVLVDDDRKFEINEIVWLELDGDRVEAKILNSRGEKFRVEYLNKKGKTKSATVSAGELTKMD